MKNPFIKQERNYVWIAAIAVGALTAGIVTWIMLKKSNRTKAVDEHLDYPYDKHPGAGTKKPKTDIKNLHAIVPEA